MEPLHIGVFPWLAIGHLTPFVELSTRLALLGHRISFLSTPSNLLRLPSNLPPLLHPVPLTPSLPLHLTSTADLSDDSLLPNLRQSFDSLAHPLSAFLRSASPPLDWLLCDYAPYWAPPLAKSYNVRSVFLSLFNAAVLSFLGPPEVLMGTERLDPEQFTVPPEWIPFPTSIVFKLHEARRVLGPAVKPDASGVSEAYRFGATIQDCDVVAVRSCIELEPELFELLPKIYKKPVIPIGHFPPVPAAQDSGDNSGKWAKAFEWLDKQAHGSVVYVAFGSEVRLEKEEVYKIAHGLELSRLPFIWALRRPNGMEEALPEGFESRTGGRGVVCEGWVPQLRFLRHSAVGGFLTHCGWNSLVEGLQFGLALILMPMIFDQALNARLLAEKGIGKEVPRDEEEGRFDGVGIAKTLRLVMVEKEGEPYRSRARELKGVLGDKEVQDSYVRKFVEYLKDHRRPLKTRLDEA